MTKAEAFALAAQIGITVKSANQLFDRCLELGYTLAVEHATGDWVILNGETEIARCK